MTKPSNYKQPNNQRPITIWRYCNNISEQSHDEHSLIWNGNRETLNKNGNSKKNSKVENNKRDSEQSNGSSTFQWIYPLNSSEKNSQNIERNSQAEKSASFEGSSPKKISRTSSLPSVLSATSSKKQPITPVPSSILRYLICVFGHFVSFFIKGGISSMMFVAELILHFFMHVLEVLNIPGSSTLGAAANAFIFLSSMLIWALYSALEFMFVIPVHLQLPYVILLIMAYYYSPVIIKDFIQSLLWAVSRFLRFFKSFIF